MVLKTGKESNKEFVVDLNIQRFKIANQTGTKNVFWSILLKTLLIADGEYMTLLFYQMSFIKEKNDKNSVRKALQQILNAVIPKKISY